MIKIDYVFTSGLQYLTLFRSMYSCHTHSCPIVSIIPNLFSPGIYTACSVGDHTRVNYIFGRNGHGMTVLNIRQEFKSVRGEIVFPPPNKGSISQQIGR